MKQDYVICDSCKSLISYKAQTGTGGMQKHIECCRQISNVLDEHNESKITKYFHSTKTKSNYVPLKFKNKITNSLVEFIILNGRPFEIVNGSGFINTIECVLGVVRTLLESSTVSASNLIVDPKTLSRHIDRIYDERKCQLISLFQTIKSFIITVDFWKGYFTGVHYAAYELENQTSPNIRRFVNSILAEFGLSFDTSSSYVVSDNENRMRCAFVDLKRVVVEKLSDEKRPTIHLVVPLRQYLINCCVIHDDDEGGLISIKKFIDDQIKTMWISQDEHLLATILHPQLKHFD
ncbi:unnamed protein product [Rotaria sordida]|uniref:Transposase n=1 Tax=Rotaria sordida TaxID=392033 RepID=A0A819VX33_9BILA|nr:unnamed protein product [Rotaria sordida]